MATTSNQPPQPPPPPDLWTVLSDLFRALAAVYGEIPKSLTVHFHGKTPALKTPFPFGARCQQPVAYREPPPFQPPAMSAPAPAAPPQPPTPAPPPPATPAPAAPADPPDLTADQRRTAAAVVEVLEAKGIRLPLTRLQVEVLRRAGGGGAGAGGAGAGAPGVSAPSRELLARLVNDGTLTHTTAGRARGFGLPEWDQPPAEEEGEAEEAEE